MVTATFAACLLQYKCEDDLAWWLKHESWKPAEIFVNVIQPEMERRERAEERDLAEREAAATRPTTRDGTEVDAVPVGGACGELGPGE
jgi:hypothetical protein